DNCFTACNECNVPVPTCPPDTVTLLEAGACGACIHAAMNTPGSACQPYVLKGGCYEEQSSPIAKCAVPPGQCTAPDCTGLSSPSTSLEDASFSLYSCLWSSCNGPCQ